MIRRLGNHLSVKATSVIEILVAFAIFGVFLTVSLVVWRTTPREPEKGIELVQAASLVSEALAWDLMRAPPLTVQPDWEAIRTRTGGELTLPRLAEYDAAKPLPLAVTPVNYVFDKARQALRRDGRTLVAGGVTAVDFRWSTTEPPELSVTLTGEARGAARAPKLEFRLPAPPGTAPVPWRYAAHHRAARVVESSPSSR